MATDSYIQLPPDASNTGKKRRTIFRTVGGEVVYEEFGVHSPADSATPSNVAGSASSVTLAAANTDRRGLIIVNDSTAILYVKFGATASATSYTYKLAAGQTLELPLPIYQGVVDGIWDSATGAARVTELE